MHDLCLVQLVTFQHTFKNVIIFPYCMQGGGRGWAAKESPRVMGGTVQQLVARLTYHRVIGERYSSLKMSKY